MANATYYKKYSREYRTQLTEEAFKDGQVFTRAPLDTGKNRVLVNYDLINEGTSITNRKGIRTSLVGMALDTDLKPTLTSDLSIHHSKDAVTEDDKHYRLVIANQYKDTDQEVPDANLRTAPSELWVVESDSADYDILKEQEISTKPMYAISSSYELPLAVAYDSSVQYTVGDFCLVDNVVMRCISDTTGTYNAANWETYVYPKSYYTVPNDAVANGIKIDNTLALAKPIGTFAWGNDYYSFNTDGDLVRTEYSPADPDNNVRETFITKKMAPKDITVTEAMTYGFNMMSKTPFSFVDNFISGKIQLDGILVYDNVNTSKLITEPKLNIPYTLRCFYSVESGVTYKYVWQYREIGLDTWNTIESKEATETSSAQHTNPTMLSVKFTCPAETVQLRVRAYKKTGGSYPDEPESEINISVSFSKANISSTSNKELINYDLSKATGMVYWHNYLWLYGLAQDPTVLFCSDTNEPTYFPYPNNIDIFDEPIISCVPFNDTLLVFTKTQLIQLTLSTSETTWTKKVIQANLDFKDFDERFIQIVKNMVFFKSGDYYYMIVPKTLSLTNELAIAPVSKNIEYFLDEFESNVKDLFEVVYDYNGTLTLVNHYNFLNYEDIHNVYVFNTDYNVYLNLVLLYNTVDRTWRMYTYESTEAYYPLKQDATKSSVLMAPCYFSVSDVDTVGVQFLEVASTNVSDFYLPKFNISVDDNTYAVNIESVLNSFSAMHKFKNWQLLDSGYRNTNTDYNKRYRELQFKFNNVSKMTIKFITEFVLDGDTRISKYRYDAEHIIDPTNPNYGVIHINRTPVENLEVPGTTTLANNDADVNAWSLSSSRFPEIAFWKARIRVSGKGYTPRFRIMSRTEERYELLGYTWVYRQLYSR